MTDHRSGTHPAGPRPPRAKLGQILVADGDLSPRDQLGILAVQNRVEARFGEILLARGLIDRDLLFDTIARQYRVPVARFDRFAADIRLIDAYGVQRCLTDGLLPWRKAGGMVVVATSRPEAFEDHIPQLEQMFGPVQMAVTGELEMHRALLSHHPRALAALAETRVDAAESCRAWPSRTLPALALGLLLALPPALALAPLATGFAFLAFAVLTLVLNSVLKLAILIGDLRAGPAEDRANAPIVARLPAVSLLVPLFREREIAERLIARLNRIDYPRELLDICLVVEADDTLTCDMLDRIRLPGHMRQIVVPQSQLRTKPRAMNYALDFCRGSIIGVYDAEDAPAPDQIHHVVQRFHERGPEVACLQGVLDFYNPRRNWLARCFAVEYATWFRVLLPGMARLGLTVPLGGTSIFFRRAALEKLGGWDAHNVTEDADLGIRLARHGYRCELIDSVTREEANCRTWSWIRQRSRWLKGYAITWAVHMRNPRRLWRDLGAWRFFGVQLLLLGTVSQFLLAPLLWSFWVLPFGLPHPLAEAMPRAALITMIVAFLAALAIDIAASMRAVIKARYRDLIPWVPSLYFYFPFAALAAYKGLLELITRPFFWEKTAHGLDDDGRAPGQAEITVPPLTVVSGEAKNPIRPL